MRPLFQTISMACCSLGLLSLTQCGGSSSNGIAPTTLNGTTVSISLGITASSFPNIFELITDNSGQSQLTTRGSQIALWNDALTVVYYKTGDSTAHLNLRWIQGTNNTTVNSLDIPSLEFDQSTHAVAGGEGATLSFQPAGEEMQTLSNITADVTIFYNN
jgi:hypothetical protein